MDEGAVAPGDLVSLLLAISVVGAVVVLGVRSVLVQPLRPVVSPDHGEPGSTQGIAVGGGRDDKALSGGLCAGFGALIRRRAGREPDPDQDRLVGRLVAAAVVVAAVVPIALPLVALGALAAAVIGQRRRRARRARAVADELPGFVDLYAVGVQAGLGSAAVIDVIVHRVGGVVAAELRTVATAHRLGRSWSELLPGLIDRLGPVSRPFLEAIEAYESSGVAITESLVEIGRSLRDDQRRQAEAGARRLPVQMLFPLIVCVLPAFLLLTVAPIVVEAFGTLRQ